MKWPVKTHGDAGDATPFLRHLPEDCRLSLHIVAILAIVVPPIRKTLLWTIRYRCVGFTRAKHLCVTRSQKLAE